MNVGASGPALRPRPKVVVFDTNVLVSALLTPLGNPGRVVEMAAIDRLTIALDDRILAEYREVLARPKLRLNQGAVGDILMLLEYSGVRVIAPPLGVTLPDPDDLPFLEVAAEAGAILVTGNLRHFPPEQRAGVQVQTPADVVTALAQHRRSDIP